MRARKPMVNGRPGRAGGGGLVAVEADAEGHRAIRSRQAEVAGHEVGVVVARRHEARRRPARACGRGDRASRALGLAQRLRGTGPRPEACRRSAGRSARFSGAASADEQRRRDAPPRRTAAAPRGTRRSLRNSFAWRPASPCSVETVSSPRSFGSTETPRPVAAGSRPECPRGSRARPGVLRKSGTCCCR